MSSYSLAYITQYLVDSESLLGLELEGPVVLLPPSLVLVLPLDHTPPLEEPVHHLELGDAP